MSETLYELIVERRIVHDGDPTMKEHVLAVADRPDRAPRISKRKSHERIDRKRGVLRCASIAL